MTHPISCIAEPVFDQEGQIDRVFITLKQGCCFCHGRDCFFLVLLLMLFADTVPAPPAAADMSDGITTCDGIRKEDNNCS